MNSDSGQYVVSWRCLCGPLLKRDLFTYKVVRIIHEIHTGLKMETLKLFEYLSKSENFSTNTPSPDSAELLNIAYNRGSYKSSKYISSAP